MTTPSWQWEVRIELIIGSNSGNSQGGIVVKLPSTIAIVIALVFCTMGTAHAGTASGTTELLGAPISGTYVDVDVAVVSEAPVVAYEYALQNECYFSGKTNGKADSFQRDDIMNWFYSSPPPNGEVPHATMTVNLLTVPAGSACKVFLVKNNQTVKGSTTIYTVQ